MTTPKIQWRVRKGNHGAYLIELRCAHMDGFGSWQHVGDEYFDASTAVQGACWHAAEWRKRSDEFEASIVASGEA